MALWGTLAIGLGIMTWPSEALAWTGQPLAYVSSNDGILVIDTGDNKVVDTIPGPSSPLRWPRMANMFTPSDPTLRR